MRKIITFLLTVLLICEIVSLCLVLNAKTFFNKGNIINKVEDDNFNNISVVEDPYLGEYFKEIYDLFEAYYIPTSILDDFIDSKVTKHFIGEVSGNMIDYILNNDDKTIVTEEYIDDLSQELADYTLKELDIDLRLDNGYFINYLGETLKDNIDLLPRTSEISTKMDGNELSILRFAMSDSLRWGLISTVIITSLIIIILNLKRGHWIFIMSLAIFISGLILLIVGMIIPSLISIINISETSIIYHLLKTMINALTNQIQNSAYIIAISSFIMMLIYIILKNFIIRSVD